MAARKKKKEVEEAQEAQYKEFDLNGLSSQARLFASDPSARLLMLCAARAFSVRQDAARAPGLPFWASEEAIKIVKESIVSVDRMMSVVPGFSFNYGMWTSLIEKANKLSEGLGKECSEAVSDWKSSLGESAIRYENSFLEYEAWRQRWNTGGYRIKTEKAAKEYEKLREESRDLPHRADRDEAKRREALSDKAGEALTRESLPKRTLGVGYAQAMLAFAQSVGKKEYERSLGKEEVSGMLDSGRGWLAVESGLAPEELDALLADKKACLAICRLAFWGPRTIECLQYWQTEEYAGNPLYNRVHIGQEGASGANELTIEPAGPLAIATRLGLLRHQGMADTWVGMSARMGIEASGRSALMAATSTGQQDGERDPDWEKVDPLGDCAPAIWTSGSSDKKAPGFAERGAVARLLLADLERSLSWRSMDALTSRLRQDQAIGAKSARFVGKEAKAREDHEMLAVSAAVKSVVANPKDRMAIGAAFAERVARGFSELEDGCDASEYLPGYDVLEQAAQEKSWSAGELARGGDPMSGVANAAASYFGIEGSDPLAKVGEARRALMESSGLSAAGWKALANNPMLREEFAKAARDSAVELAAAARESRKAARPRAFGAARQAEAVMKAADASGSSAEIRLLRIVEKESAAVRIEGVSKLLSAATAGGFSPEDQSRLLMAAAESRELTAFLSGRLPCRPAGLDEGLGAKKLAALAAQIQEDVEALPALVPAMLRELLARTRRFEAAGESEASARAQARAEFECIVDCARAMPAGFWSGLDKKAPWAHGLRQHEAWSHELRLKEMAADAEAAREWERVLGSARIGRASARELASAPDLLDEGREMKHCVGSYAELCKTGRSRIFSLSLDGQRAATLELGAHDAGGRRLHSVDFADPVSRERVARWTMVQNRGPYNAAVKQADLLELSKKVERDAQVSFEARTVAIKREAAEAARVERLAKEALKASGSVAAGLGLAGSEGSGVGEKLAKNRSRKAPPRDGKASGPDGPVGAA